MATAKARVLIVSDRSLFAEGIDGLLRQERGLEIVALETEPGQALGRTRECHPDVVVLTDGEAATGLDVELLRLVREGFRLSIVEVHRVTNSLCIYCGEQQPIGEVRDLVDTLQGICDGLTREAHVPPVL